MSAKELSSSSTTEDVLADIDLAGKVVIITGANSGIGYETAKALAHHGAHVVMAVRNEARALEAIETIVTEKPDAKLTFIPCDLERFDSVRGFCRSFIEKKLPLDILILNAAVNAVPYIQTVDGHELTFQVNHLAHFLLVKLLESKLIESAPSRVVVVSSESHRWSTISEKNFDIDWNSSNFISMMAYNDSKLCNTVMANELQRRLEQHNVTAVSCHPGNLVYTNIQRYWWPLRLVYRLAQPFTKTADQGAATVVYCAVGDAKAMAGQYYNNCRPCAMSTTAANEELASKLWKRWEDITQHEIDK